MNIKADSNNTANFIAHHAKAVKPLNFACYLYSDHYRAATGQQQHAQVSAESAATPKAATSRHGVVSAEYPTESHRSL